MESRVFPGFLDGGSIDLLVQYFSKGLVQPPGGEAENRNSEHIRGAAEEAT